MIIVFVNVELDAGSKVELVNDIFAEDEEDEL